MRKRRSYSILRPRPRFQFSKDKRNMRKIGILGAIARRQSQTAEQARQAALKASAVRWRKYFSEKGMEEPSWIGMVLGAIPVRLKALA